MMLLNNMLLNLMQTFMPDFLKRKKLIELFRLTADAFQSGLPELGGLSYVECLSKYALFTKEWAEDYLQSGCPHEELKQRLYQNSYVFGKGLRKSLRIATWKQAVEALEAIYKLIGIDLRYDQGEVKIIQCYFSRYYSGAVCRLISSLDEGIAAGLSGGGRLRFDQRMTEGGSFCTGCFTRGFE